MSDCSVEALRLFIRENSADCHPDNKYKRSNEYIDCAIQFSVQQVVKDKSDDFQEAVEIELDNGTCIQSACPECSGIVDIVGNVNGGCDSPFEQSDKDKENDSYYRSIYSSLKCVKLDDDSDYRIVSFEVLGDGGCQFKVEPAVPSIGTYKLHVLCVVLPDLDNGEIPPQLCRHFYLVAAKALFWIYTYEADPTMKIKAEMFDKAYYRMLEEDRNVNRDVFLESIVFGSRKSSDDD